MSDNPCVYLCAQLQAALSDSPGGEKAWVPLRRSTVHTRRTLAEAVDAAAAEFARCVAKAGGK